MVCTRKHQVQNHNLLSLREYTLLKLLSVSTLILILDPIEIHVFGCPCVSILRILHASSNFAEIQLDFFRCSKSHMQQILSIYRITFDNVSRQIYSNV